MNWLNKVFQHDEHHASIKNKESKYLRIWKTIYKILLNFKKQVTKYNCFVKMYKCIYKNMLFFFWIEIICNKTITCYL